MKRVLMCLSSLSNGNGIARVIMNYYNQLIENDYQVDFLCMLSNRKNNDRYIETIKSNKGNIYIVKKHNILERFLTVKKEVKKLVIKNNYDIVHVNLLDIYALACISSTKRYSDAKIIYHIHNPKTKTKLGKLSDFFNYICMNKASMLLACSFEAGKSMFAEKDFLVVNNSINVEDYKFNKNKRQELRKKMNIQQEEIVIGIVARIIEQKNPFFVVEILKELIKIGNYRLVWIGDGPQRKNIEEYINSLNLNEKVEFLGEVNDVENYYSAMDIFILPSKFEGLGIVLLEAQANGLPVYTSDVVPKITKITDLIKFLDLNETSEAWAAEINKIQLCIEERERYNQLVKKSDFQINSNNNSLIECYKKI